jgi:hypothetical protein
MLEIIITNYFLKEYSENSAFLFLSERSVKIFLRRKLFDDFERILKTQRFNLYLLFEKFTVNRKNNTKDFGTLPISYP